MKKIFTFFSAALILFFVYACTLPSEVEITGSPSVKFAANMDFGDYFSGMIDDVVNSDSSTQTIICTNPSFDYLVFILRMEIFRKENFRCDPDDALLGGSTSGNIVINGVEIPVHSIESERKYIVLDERRDIASSTEPHTTSFKGLEDYLEGFEFFDVHAKIYISGTALADVVNIVLHRVLPDGTDELLVEEGDITSKVSSGLENLSEYNGTELPPGGAEIEITDILNTGGDLSINYEVFMPAGAEIAFDMLEETHSVIAEIVIWLPMTLESKDENAHFKFPDFFDGITGILKSLAGVGCVEDLSIEITIDPLNPFGHGIFIISDDGYGDIDSPLDEHHFYIKLNKDELDYINNNPYDPHFIVSYPVIHTILEIPKGEIMVSTVKLDVKLKYNAEF